MAQSFKSIVREWGRTVTESERKDLEKLSMIGLLGLKNIAFDSGFLQVALEYWNPNTHCFKFGSDKISPLPEEFGAILGFPSRVLVALPSLCEFYYKDFEGYFNLHTPLLTRIVHGQ